MAGAEQGVGRIVLRAAVGDENYPDVEALAGLLEALHGRGLISEEGLGHLISTLADEIVTHKVLREFGLDLSILAVRGDTPLPEDPPE